MTDKEIDFEAVKSYLETCSENTKIYIGADSERVNVEGIWHVDVMACLIVHLDQKHGGKFFGQIRRQRDYDKALNRPRLRMMMEAYAAAELYLQYVKLLDKYEVDLHLDINSKPEHGSNCAYNEAVGYIKGVCGFAPITKPHSWCASNCADATRRLLSI